jgi:hypothetical protein
LHHQSLPPPSTAPRTPWDPTVPAARTAPRCLWAERPWTWLVPRLCPGQSSVVGRAPRQAVDPQQALRSSCLHAAAVPPAAGRRARLAPRRQEESQPEPEHTAGHCGPGSRNAPNPAKRRPELLAGSTTHVQAHPGLCSARDCAVRAVLPHLESPDLLRGHVVSHGSFSM